MFFNIIQDLKYNKFISFPTILTINCNNFLFLNKIYSIYSIYSISNSIRVIKT